MMIDNSRVHPDFRDQFLSQSNANLVDKCEPEPKSPQETSNKNFVEFEWIEKAYCPCCGIDHEMLLIHHSNISKNISSKQIAIINSLKEELLMNTELMNVNGDFFDGKNLKEKVSEINKKIEYALLVQETNEKKKDQSRIYCPYFPKVMTGWNNELYAIIAGDYTNAINYGKSGYNFKSEYVVKINLIKAMLEKNNKSANTLPDKALEKQSNVEVNEVQGKVEVNEVQREEMPSQVEENKKIYSNPFLPDWANNWLGRIGKHSKSSLEIEASRKSKPKSGTFLDWLFDAPICEECGEQTKLSNCQPGSKYLGSGFRSGLRGLVPTQIRVFYFVCEFCDNETAREVELDC